MAEDESASTPDSFALKYSVDEHDSLHFAKSLSDLGYGVYFANWRDLQIISSGTSSFSRMYFFNDSCYCPPVEISEFDLSFVYKMEGFYQNLSRFESMLKCFENNLVLNELRTIRHNLNKGYLWQLEEKGIRIIPSFQTDEIKDGLAAGERFVIKPFCGERGCDIFLANCLDDLTRINGQEHNFFAQQFRPEIWEGERSLVFLGDEFQHAVIKKPSRAADSNEFRCNESLGGSVDVYDPSSVEIDFAQSVLYAFVELGYPAHFSRVDILSCQGAPMLLEAELLNPSMYANYSGKGETFGRRVATYFDNFVRRKKVR